MTKEEIKANTNIYDVLTRYGVKFNNHNRCKCFLHGGKDYNMSIKGDYCKCFVCGETVDVFSVVQHFERCDFTEAMRILGGDQELSYKQFRASARREQEERERLARDKKTKNMTFQQMDKYYKTKDLVENIGKELGQDAFDDEKFLQAVQDLSKCEVSRALWSS